MASTVQGQDTTTQIARHIQTYYTVAGNGAEGINLDEDGYDADPMDGFDDGTIFPTQTQVGGATLQYSGVFFVCIWTPTRDKILAQLSQNFLVTRCTE